MSSAFVPRIKELVRRNSLDRARAIADRVLRMKTAGETRGFLTRPNVSILDMGK
jgi:hypothetical protein